MIGALIATARNGCSNSIPKMNATTVKMAVGTIGFSIDRFSLMRAASMRAVSMVLFFQNRVIYEDLREIIARRDWMKII